MNIISTGCIAIANTFTHTHTHTKTVCRVHQWNINTTPARIGNQNRVRWHFQRCADKLRCDANTNALYCMGCGCEFNQLDRGVWCAGWYWIRISSHIIRSFFFEIFFYSILFVVLLFVRLLMPWCLGALHVQAKSDKKTRVATRHRTYTVLRFSFGVFFFFLYSIIFIQTRNHFSLLDTVSGENWLWRLSSTAVRHRVRMDQ